TVGSGAALSVNSGGILINSGTFTPTGALTFGASGIYRHNQNLGTIPTATWNATSTCEITGWTSTSGGSGFGQSFGNFTWNSPGSGATYNFSGALTSVAGNLRIQNSGHNSIRLAASQS